MREGSKMKIRWQEVRHEGMMVFWLGFSESGTHIATIRTKQTQKGFRWVLEITQAHILGMRQLENKMPLGEATLEPWKPRTGWDAVKQTKYCFHCEGTGKADLDNPCGFCDEVVEVGVGQAEYLTRQAEAWFQTSQTALEGLGW